MLNHNDKKRSEIKCLALFFCAKICFFNFFYISLHIFIFKGKFLYYEKSIIFNDDNLAIGRVHQARDARLSIQQAED